MPSDSSETTTTRVRLRTVTPSPSWWRRRQAGRGFSYCDAEGHRLDSVSALRCRQLVIPPAWQDVLICPYPNGHIQAVGVDARGRRQYIYHQQWRVDRNKLKHDHVLKLARRLPRARAQIRTALAQPGMPEEKALATAFSMLDLGYFRIGSDTYASENGSYGLTTLERRHVRRRDGRLVFEFRAKSGVSQHIEIVDPSVLASVDAMRTRRSGPDTLLAYRSGRKWQRIDADDVNEYLRSLLGQDVTAKDFRTWHGTVYAALALAGAPSQTERARTRSVAAAMRSVAEHLGNTPTVARASYVDKRLIDLFQSGETIAPSLPRIRRLKETDPRRQQALEGAVRRLLDRS